ncbi:MAG: DUF2269 family protein [Acidimicrobiia bacterium]|nr:DUF2269 family protein [Acidimicrobiia bacterium]
MRETLLVLHIIGVATWLGADLVQLTFNRRLTAMGGQPAALWVNTTAVAFARVLYIPSGLLILVTGILMVVNSDVYEFDNIFVGIGIAVVVLGAILGVVVFGRRGERAAQAFAEGEDAEGRSIMTKMTPFGVLDAALVVFAIVAMVGRWGA